MIWLGKSDARFLTLCKNWPYQGSHFNRGLKIQNPRANFRLRNCRIEQRSQVELRFKNFFLKGAKNEPSELHLSDNLPLGQQVSGFGQMTDRILLRVVELYTPRHGLTPKGSGLNPLGGALGPPLRGSDPNPFGTNHVWGYTTQPP